MILHDFAIAFSYPLSRSNPWWPVGPVRHIWHISSSSLSKPSPRTTMTKMMRMMVVWYSNESSHSPNEYLWPSIPNGPNHSTVDEISYYEIDIVEYIRLLILFLYLLLSLDPWGIFSYVFVTTTTTSLMGSSIDSMPIYQHYEISII